MDDQNYGFMYSGETFTTLPRPRSLAVRVAWVIVEACITLVGLAVCIGTILAVLVA